MKINNATKCQAWSKHFKPIISSEYYALTFINIKLLLSPIVFTKIPLINNANIEINFNKFI